MIMFRLDSEMVKFEMDSSVLSRGELLDSKKNRDIVERPTEQLGPLSNVPAHTLNC